MWSRRFDPTQVHPAGCGLQPDVADPLAGGHVVSRPGAPARGSRANGTACQNGFEKSSAPVSCQALHAAGSSGVDRLVADAIFAASIRIGSSCLRRGRVRHSWYPFTPGSAVSNDRVGPGFSPAISGSSVLLCATSTATPRGLQLLAQARGESCWSSTTNGWTAQWLAAGLRVC